MPHCNATCFWWWRVYPSTVDGSLSPHKMDSNGKFNAWNYIVSVQQNKIDQRIFPTQKYLCQTDIKEKSSAKCSHMYVQHVMYVDYYLKECKSTEWKFPVLTFLTLLLSGGCGLWSWARYEFAELYCCRAPDRHVLNLRCSHGTRRGARRRLGGGLACCSIHRENKRCFWFYLDN